MKTKAHADFTRITQRFEHGIPLRHFEDYKRVQALTGCKVYLFICEDDTGDILSKPIDELDAHKRIYRGNEMSRGGMVFFPRDSFDVFSKGSP